MSQRNWNKHEHSTQWNGGLVTVTVLSLVFGCGGCRQEKRPDEPLPSVILISIDTLRADRMSVYGYERPTTPRLEEIAEGLETRLRTIRASDTRVLG